MNARVRLPDAELLEVGERCGWRCHVCQLGWLADDPWETDHNRALVRGGTNHRRNFQLAHRSCNRRKGAA